MQKLNQCPQPQRRTLNSALGSLQQNLGALQLALPPAYLSSIAASFAPAAPAPAAFAFVAPRLEDAAVPRDVNPATAAPVAAGVAGADAGRFDAAVAAGVAHYCTASAYAAFAASSVC